MAGALPASWGAAPARPVLVKDEVHLWRFSLATTEGQTMPLRDLLTPEETARADRLLRPADGRRFTVGRARLRQILARYAALPAAQLPLLTGPQGKPALAGSPFFFNLAHSGDLALCVVTRVGEVGIDLEAIRSDLPFANLAGRYFSAAESAALRRLPAADQHMAFYRIWTRKEAYLKARGSGLNLPLERFDVSPAAETVTRLLAHRDEPQEIHRWRLVDIPAGPPYVATLALPLFALTPSLWDFDSPFSSFSRPS